MSIRARLSTGKDTGVDGHGDDVEGGTQGDGVLDGNEGFNIFVSASGPAGSASKRGPAQTAATDFASIQALAQTLTNGGDAYAFGADGILFTDGGSGMAITDAARLAGAGKAASLKFTDIAHGPIS